MRQTLFLPRGQKRPGRRGFSGLRLYWGMKAGWGCSLWCPRKLPTFHPANCHRHFEMTRAERPLFCRRYTFAGAGSAARQTVVSAGFRVQNFGVDGPGAKG